MRRLATLLGVLFVSALPVYGQLTFSADEYARDFFGETVVDQGYIAFTPIPATHQALIDKKGANQTWDFTAFTYEMGDGGETVFVSPPTGVPGINEPQYAGADYATLSVFGDSTASVFFQLDDNAHYNLGTYAETDQGLYKDYYDAPFQSLAFPLTMGTAWTAQGTLTSENPLAGTTTAQVTQSGTVDGYGTLITPAGTAECLRLVFQLDTTASGFTITQFIYTWITKEGIAAGATSLMVFGQTIRTASYSVRDFDGGSGTPPASAPQNLTPANGASNQATSPVLSWEAVDTATGYDLQVADNDGFTKTHTLFVDEENLSTMSYQVAGLNEGTTYFWHVRARNDAGAGPWSGTQSFTTETSIEAPAQVVLTAPADDAGDLDTMPTLSWQSTIGADSYTVQVATDDAFSSVVVDETNLSETSLAIGPLADGTTYYWHVRATNTGGEGPWSETRRFTTATGVGLEQVGDAIPHTLALHANYPNPFNPTTSISFDLPAASHVQLLVYDLAGREVARLIDQPLSAGAHRAIFDATALPSGTYLYRLHTDTAELTRPMTLIK